MNTEIIVGIETTTKTGTGTPTLEMDEEATTDILQEETEGGNPMDILVIETTGTIATIQGDTGMTQILHHPYRLHPAILVGHGHGDTLATRSSSIGISLGPWARRFSLVKKKSSSSLFQRMSVN